MFFGAYNIKGNVHQAKLLDKARSTAISSPTSPTPMDRRSMNSKKVPRATTSPIWSAVMLPTDSQTRLEPCQQPELRCLPCLREELTFPTRPPGDPVTLLWFPTAIITSSSSTILPTFLFNQKISTLSIYHYDYQSGEASITKLSKFLTNIQKN